MKALFGPATQPRWHTRGVSLHCDRITIEGATVVEGLSLTATRPSAFTGALLALFHQIRTTGPCASAVDVDVPRLLETMKPIQ